MKRIGIYAGSFDPPTRGHLWMMQQGATLFDELIVVLAVNPDKPGFLTAEERVRVLRALTAELPPNVRLEVSERGFLVDFAKHLGATHLLRGIRNSVDLEYEKCMERMNAAMEPGIRSVYLLPPPELEAISSSLVRGFAGQPGNERWLAATLPPGLPPDILRRFS